MILPEANQEDLSELPDLVRQEIEFVFAEPVEEVFEAAIPQSEERLTILSA